MSGDAGDPGDRPLSELTDEELHQEGMQALSDQKALDPANANLNPQHIEGLREENRARLGAITEEQRWRKRARQQGAD